MIDLATAYLLIALNLCLLGPYFVYRFHRARIEHHFGWVLVIGGVGSALRFYKHSNLIQQFPYLFDIELPIVLMAAFSFQRMLKAQHLSFKKISPWFIALPIVVVFYLYNLVPFLKYKSEYLNYINLVKADENAHYQVFAYVYGFLYLLITANINWQLKGLKPHKDVEANPSEEGFKQTYTFKWLRQYFGYLFLLCSFALLVSVFVPIYSVFKWVPLCLLPSFWFAFIKIIRSPGFVFIPVEREVIVEREVFVKGISSKVDEEKGLSLSVEDAEKLQEIWLLVNEKVKRDKLFLQQHLTVQLLSEALELKSYQVSKAINTAGKTNFNDFIAQFRVEFAKQLLKSEQQKHLTVEAIGAESGFPSKTTFYDSFKKITGLTPAQYRREL